MMKFGNISLFISLFFGAVNLSAQDLHFSQFDQNLLYSNPAMIGKFNGLSKFNLSYRTQWSSVTVPYESLSAAAETSSLFGTNKFGGGISFFRNNAGDSEFEVNSFNLGLSYSIKLNKNSALSLGFLGGVNTFTLDYNKLRYNSQYVPDKGFDPTVPNGESLSVESVTLPSLATGLSFHGKYAWGTLNTGFGLFNVLPSQLQFYNAENNPYEQRYTFNFNAEIKAGLNYFIPLIYLSQHQSLSESLFGAKYRYTIGQANNALDFGTVYRGNDAYALIFGLKFSDVYIGYSFDANVSDLQKSSNNRGASEISISYIYSPVKSYKRKFDSCPVFL